MNSYLASTDYIDWRAESVLRLAENLKQDSDCAIEIAKTSFAYVRDQIAHSSDAGGSVVTIKASDVLAQKTGVCFAKSHLFAALLRANGIPAALCYQRLSLGNGNFSLHGLNAVYLKDIGWYRADPRGDNANVSSRFEPPSEHLAFSATKDGEVDSYQRFDKPLPVVIAYLQAKVSSQHIEHDLPDALLDE